MAVSMKSSVQMRAAAARPARTAVVVRASAENVDRRQVLGLFAAVVGAVALPQQASARVLPWQESTGGMAIGKGSIPKSSTLATSEGYTLEGFPGTKKPSYLEPKKKKALLAKARAQAEKAQ